MCAAQYIPWVDRRGECSVGRRQRSVEWCGGCHWHYAKENAHHSNALYHRTPQLPISHHSNSLYHRTPQQLTRSHNTTFIYYHHDAKLRKTHAITLTKPHYITNTNLSDAKRAHYNYNESSLTTFHNMHTSLLQRVIPLPIAWVWLKRYFDTTHKYHVFLLR